jgi:hypothetical protein
MRVRSRWTIPKELDLSEINEDKVRIRTRLQAGRHKLTLAVSDGASESFDSARWADILATEFTIRPDFGPASLERAITKYHSRIDRNSLSWSGQASFDRGSFATLLGLYWVDDEIKLIAVGDSVAVLVADGQIIYTFPFSNASQFSNTPPLISSLANLNTEIFGQSGFPSKCSWKITDLKHVTVFCMTDALAMWLLSAPDRRIRVLTTLQNGKEFKQLVRSERTSGAIRHDDTTLVIVDEGGHVQDKSLSGHN